MSRVATWFACSSRERRLLGKAWLLLLLAGVALRCLSLPRVQKLLVSRPGRSRQIGQAVAANRLAWLVRAAARFHPWKVGCLERSLVLQAILSGSGTRPEVRIGVRRDGGSLRAHAWVEIEGLPVGEAPDITTQFQPFPRALPR